MLKAIEAIIDDRGQVRLLHPVRPGSCRRALVVILDEPASPDEETALLSEAALQDWSRPEEDAAWAHLHRGE